MKRALLALAALVISMLSAVPASAEGPAFDTRPAEQALARLIPENHRQVELKAISGDGDRFRVTGDTGRITVEGTSPAALLTGFNAYLKEAAHADISWNGEQLDLPRRLPAPRGEIARSANVRHRFAFNDTNDGYTGPYRDWKDWERTIDVLALHGVNEVLVYIGADSTYYDTFKEFGYSDAELRAWIPGPAHQPWWLLQNISGMGGPVSEQLLDRRADLARKIVKRLRELGMTPVLPGYFGTVPDGFTDRNPGSRVVPQGNWGGVRRPDWLDPRTPAFAEVAESFYRHQRELLGDTTMYKMDLLHEGGNPGDVPVGEAAKAVEKALRTAHPGAIWNILGWQTNPRKEILEAVDRSKMFIVDGLSDRYSSVTDREKDWLGTPYAFGSIWNFGGHTAMGANTPDWVREYPRWRDKENSALSGIALMPEGSDNNPAALELFTELAWTPGAIDLDTWFAGFARSRYGGDDPHAAAAWKALRDTAYGMSREDSWSEAPDGLFAARPSLTAASAGVWSPQAMRYDAARFDKALDELLKVSPRLRNSSAYRYDLADVTRQALSNRSRMLLPQIKAAYDAKDQARFRDLTRTWLSWMDLQERVVATNDQHLLGRWLDQARRWAADGAERKRLEYDARSILTTWGGRQGSEEGLHDYANREWSGLVGGLYTERWKKYFGELDSALADGRAPKQIDWFAVDDAWARRHDSYPTKPRGDVHEVAGQVAGELAGDAHHGDLRASTDNGSITGDRPVTVTATFTNRNGLAPVRDVKLDLKAPDGLTAEPLTPVTAGEVAPGGSITAKWKVTLQDAGDRLLADLPVTASYTAGRRPGTATATPQVLAATGVKAPYKSASFNDAVFGQSADGGALAIEGAGADMWAGTKEFGSIYLGGALGTSGTVTARVTHQDPTGPWARAGLVVRDDLADNGAPGLVDLAVTPSNGCVLSWDSDGDGTIDSVRSAGGFAAPAHVRLTRSGTSYKGECSTDGTTWTEIGTAEVRAAAPSQDAGVFMTAANGWTGTRGIAAFDGLRIG